MMQYSKSGLVLQVNCSSSFFIHNGQNKEAGILLRIVEVASSQEIHQPAQIMCVNQGKGALSSNSCDSHARAQVITRETEPGFQSPVVVAALSKDTGSQNERDFRHGFRTPLCYSTVAYYRASHLIFLIFTFIFFVKGK